MSELKVVANKIKTIKTSHKIISYKLVFNFTQKVGAWVSCVISMA